MVPTQRISTSGHSMVRGSTRESAEPGCGRDHDLRVGGAGCVLDGRWTMHPSSYEHHRQRCVLALLETPLIRREPEQIPRFRICCKTTSSSRLFAANGAHSCFFWRQGVLIATGIHFLCFFFFFVAASIAFTIPSVAAARPGRNTIDLPSWMRQRVHIPQTWAERARQRESPYMSHDIFSTTAPLGNSQSLAPA